MAQRIVPALLALILSMAGGSPAASRSCAAGSLISAGPAAAPFLPPEPIFVSTVCIPPNGKVTCSGNSCHNCQSDATCSPTQTADHFKVYRNSDSATRCCTLNGYINGYPQCQGGPFWWMTFGHYTKQCNCV